MVPLTSDWSAFNHRSHGNTDWQKKLLLLFLFFIRNLFKVLPYSSKLLFLHCVPQLVNQEIAFYCEEE